jgi:hypothetical protein
VNGVESKKILELEKENKRLAVKNKELEEKLEKANSIVMAYTNELQTREVMKGVWETQSPLISSQSDTDHSKQWYSERHQSDCITINQLHTTLDVLVDRYANLRKIHGLS